MGKVNHIKLAIFEQFIKGKAIMVELLQSMEVVISINMSHRLL